MIGGLSMTELVIILGLALLLLGPDQLPSIAKSLGKGLRELRKTTDDLKSQFEQEIASVDLDEQKTPRMIAPLQVTSPASGPAPTDGDPAAARAGARNAASTSPGSTSPAGHGERVSFPTPPAAPEGTVPARDSKA
jgi:sec-independent protein translocase protein TatB